VGSTSNSKSGLDEVSFAPPAEGYDPGDPGASMKYRELGIEFSGDEKPYLSLRMDKSSHGKPQNGRRFAEGPPRKVDPEPRAGLPVAC
jgi:hypothetical protein